MISLDANILVYAAQTADDPRRSRAIDIVQRAALADNILPMQALTEFANACRKRKLLDTDFIAIRVIEWAEVFNVGAAIPADVATALSWTSRFNLSFYDALVSVTTRRSGGTVMFSEDMHDGADHAGLRIINPFNAANIAMIETLLPAVP